PPGSVDGRHPTGRGCTGGPHALREDAAARPARSGSGNGDGETNRAAARFLTGRELAAADEVVRRVRARVPATLALALLFGSKARRQARPDSDVDVLLVFRRLTWDREPQAGMAERIAHEVASETGVPVATWTVSLV